MNPEQLNLIIQSIGSIAEMSLIFFNSTVSAGADAKTAIALTEAFMRAIITGNSKGKNLDEQDE